MMSLPRSTDLLEISPYGQKYMLKTTESMPSFPTLLRGELDYGIRGRTMVWLVGFKEKLSRANFW
jgi:hypothetical protein